MERRLMLLVALAVAGVACGSDEPGAVSSTVPVTIAATTTTTVPVTTRPASTSTSTTTGGIDSEPLSVATLLDTRPDGSVAVGGAYYDNGAGPLLCEALAESFPPQCAGRWLILSAAPDADVTTEGGVSWTDRPLVLTGTLAGDYFVVDGTELPTPTADEQALVDSIVSFARARAELDPQPFAGEVGIGLAGELLTSRTPSELAEPAAWVIDTEFFRARTGPFSALDLLGPDRPHVVIVGPHNHCASRPVPPPDGFADHRRVSIQPTDVTSCIEWFTVDLFVGPDQTVEAITLDLFEP